VFEVFNLERTMMVRGDALVKRSGGGQSPVKLLLDFERDHVCVSVKVLPALFGYFSHHDRKARHFEGLMGSLMLRLGCPVKTMNVMMI